MLSAIKNFGITFLVSILIFGVVAFFATRFVTGTVESILASEKEQLDSIIKDSENISGDGLDPQKQNTSEDINGNSFTFLMLTTDYFPEIYDDYILSADDTEWFSEAAPEQTIGILNGGYRTAHISSAVLVRVDKESRSFVYTYLSPSIRVSTSSGYHTLSEVYYMYGLDKFKEYVTSLTGMETDYCFLLSGRDFDVFTTIAGTIQAENPAEIYYDGRYYTYASMSSVDGFDENGERTTVTNVNEFVMSSGSFDMTSDRLYTVLSVLEHSKADLINKQTVALNIAEQYINHFASLSKALLGETITNLTVTKGIVYSDFTARDLDSVYELFSYADRFEPVKITYPCVHKSGTESSADYFKPEIEKAVGLFSGYRGKNID